LLVAVPIAAHAIAVIVPDVISAEVFGAAIDHMKANDRFDVKVVFVSAFRATHAFEANGIRHDETPFVGDEKGKGRARRPL
jgi:hypothetical protein